MVSTSLDIFWSKYKNKNMIKTNQTICILPEKMLGNKLLFLYKNKLDMKDKILLNTIFIVVILHV